MQEPTEEELEALYANHVMQNYLCYSEENSSSNNNLVVGVVAAASGSNSGGGTRKRERQRGGEYYDEGEDCYDEWERMMGIRTTTSAAATAAV